jgi:hypothetical protein
MKNMYSIYQCFVQNGKKFPFNVIWNDPVEPSTYIVHYTVYSRSGSKWYINKDETTYFTDPKKRQYKPDSVELYKKDFDKILL